MTIDQLLLGSSFFGGGALNFESDGGAWTATQN